MEKKHGPMSVFVHAKEKGMGQTFVFLSQKKKIYDNKLSFFSLSLEKRFRAEKMLRFISKVFLDPPPPNEKPSSIGRSNI